MHSEYFLVLLAAVFFPFLLSFRREVALFRHGRALALAIAVPLLLFGAWDIAATARGHWSFNPAYVVGVTIVNLPVEEWLFFVVLPFVSVFTWEALRHIQERRG
jgi:lycopene cyclase domain-containing protein